mmetsp:Transcript_2255/g.5355  ORF Transcript_2255/g.5355 Transcript_2255/m.5355 type:complete len:288 (-) Transcript_2255:250-1113(-)
MRAALMGATFHHSQLLGVFRKFLLQPVQARFHVCQYLDPVCRLDLLLKLPHLVRIQNPAVIGARNAVPRGGCGDGGGSYAREIDCAEEFNIGGGEARLEPDVVRMKTLRNKPVNHGLLQPNGIRIVHHRRSKIDLIREKPVAVCGRILGSLADLGSERVPKCVAQSKGVAYFVHNGGHNNERALTTFDILVELLLEQIKVPLCEHIVFPFLRVSPKSVKVGLAPPTALAGVVAVGVCGLQAHKQGVLVAAPIRARQAALLAVLKVILEVFNFTTVSLPFGVQLPIFG